MIRRILILLALAACGSTDVPPARLADFPGITAIIVTLPEMRDATEFEYALSSALGARDLPAYFSSAGPPQSYALKISSAPPRLHGVLSDPSGKELGAFDTEKNAEQVAERVAAILLPPPPERPQQPKLAHIAVLQGVGAPGDGNQALTRAMTQLLIGKVPLDQTPNASNYALGVTVTRKADARTDQIALDWTIKDPKGREIAHIGQANAVATGALDRNWGSVAYDAAVAAASALVPVIVSLPPEPLP